MSGCVAMSPTPALDRTGAKSRARPLAFTSGLFFTPLGKSQ